MFQITNLQILKAIHNTVYENGTRNKVDLNETPAEKIARINKLENNLEMWFKYYFKAYYMSEPAQFHIKASKRIICHAEWYEVRS